jgi:dipeptidyl aminopeptidase/acylaminoacyl peptidase
MLQLKVLERVRSHALWIAATAVMATAATGSVAAQETFSLDQVMGAAFPSGLIADQERGVFAWVMNEAGARNIWISESPSYAGRRATTYSSDDGQEIGSLRFTADGRLLFVRGGAPNRQGEIPNPTSDSEGAERAIWILDLDGDEAGRSRQLAAGSSPTPSPDGSRVAFLRRGQVWAVPLDDPGEAETPAESGQVPVAPDAPAGARPLFQIRGSAGSLSWSPDGSQLAFVSNRGDHSFIGLYTLADESVRYLDASLARDGSPTWSPDGGRLAFIRITNERDRLPFAARRTALPWSIRVVDLESGAGREAWRASEGRGSAFRGVESTNQLWWTAGDRIAFPWERDGWTHLYTIPAGGGEPTLLTPGAFEVEHVTLTPDRERLVYSSNEGDIDRRHVWSVAVARGAPEALTTGSGIEWSPAVAADGQVVAFLASDAHEPAHAEVLGANGERIRVATEGIPADFPIDHLVTPEAVTFVAEDGQEIHGQLFTPTDIRPGDRRPALIFFHGGSRRQMLLGWHYRGYYHNAYAFNQYMTSRGYVVLSVNYRSGIGYGMEFREAIDYGARGASEYRDVLAAGRYLADRADVDAARIGLWGGSYGGYLTALGLARDSDLFAAGVDLHGVHDWNVVIRNFVPAYQAERRAEVARLAFESSPMASVDRWRSPVLLIHGDDDRNVPFSESVDLVEALQRRDVTVEQLVFPDEVHSFLLHRNWVAAFEAAADFFDRTLGHDPKTAADAATGDR